VFLNAPEAKLGTALDVETGYAGSFVIFGHGGCYGSAGHCQVPTDPRDPFDKRPPHAMTPLTKLVEITEALKHPRCTGETLAVSVVPVIPGRERARQADVLSFTGLRLLAYR
jgi:tyrosinase